MERRLALFRAIAPALAQRGPSALTMAQAARISHASVGTLYHYFGSKRRLVLYGLDPEPAALICARFEAEHGHLEATDPDAFRAAVATLVADTAALMRASADAAISLGPEVLRERMQRVTQHPVPAFVDLVRRAIRAGSRRDATDVERAIRRSVGAALLERDFREEELVAHFRALLG